MSEKSRIPPGFLNHSVQCHYPIERHEAAMHSHQHSPALRWNVFDAFVFNTPVELAQKLEQGLAIEADVVFVHAEFIELRFRFRRMTVFIAQCHQRGEA